jgi:hypothetical protein
MFYGRNMALKMFWAYFQSNPSFNLSLCSFSSCWRGFGTKALGEKFRLVSFRQKLRCRVLFRVTTRLCARSEEKITKNSSPQRSINPKKTSPNPMTFYAYQRVKNAPFYAYHLMIGCFMLISHGNKLKSVLLKTTSFFCGVCPVRFFSPAKTNRLGFRFISLNYSVES